MDFKGGYWYQDWSMEWVFLSRDFSEMWENEGFSASFNALRELAESNRQITDAVNSA